MLPSMPSLGLLSTPGKDRQNEEHPLFSSTPVKERQNEELPSLESSTDDHSQLSSKVLDLSMTPKKSSPLKHVTPILKKYNCHRIGKGGKKVGLLSDQPQIRDKYSFLRPIAPKPVPITISPTKEDSTALKKNTETVDDKKEEGSETSETKKERLKKDGSKDKQDELEALMQASVTIRPPKVRQSTAERKKLKQMRDMETAVTLLTPDDPLVKEEKSFGFAQAYFMKVKERLEGTDLYQSFLHIMNEFGTSILEVTDLYKEVTALFSSHPDLSEEFLAFLLPEQAMKCGKLMEYLMITKMRDFFRKLEIYYAKQPLMMRKFYAALTSLGGQPNVTISDVRSAILPLLKGNAVLVENFLSLLPEEKPSESMMQDFEELDFANKDPDRMGEEDMFETLMLPSMTDSFGGYNCPCTCHRSGDERYSRSKRVHCLSCGTRFIQGKVFLQAGRVLRPAEIQFEKEKLKATIERLSSKSRPKVHRKRSNGPHGDSPFKHLHFLFGGNEGSGSPKPRGRPRKTLMKSKSPKCGRKFAVRSTKTSTKNTQARAKQSAAHTKNTAHSTNTAAGGCKQTFTNHSTTQSMGQVGGSTVLASKLTTVGQVQTVSGTVRPVSQSRRDRVKHETVSKQKSGKSPTILEVSEADNKVPSESKPCSIFVEINVKTEGNITSRVSDVEDLRLPSPVNQEEHDPLQTSVEMAEATVGADKNTEGMRLRSHSSLNSHETSGITDSCIAQDSHNKLPLESPQNETVLATDITSSDHVIPVSKTVLEIHQHESHETSNITDSCIAQDSYNKLPLESPQNETVVTTDITSSDHVIPISKTVLEIHQHESAAVQEKDMNQHTIETSDITIEEDNSTHLVEQSDLKVFGEEVEEPMEESVINEETSKMETEELCNVETTVSSSSYVEGSSPQSCLEEKETNSDEKMGAIDAWTRDEDKIILQMYKLGYSFQEISDRLPQRSVDEVRNRFDILIEILKQMTVKKEG